MYEDLEHRQRFIGPGSYLFRGTLPSTAFSRPYRGCGVTPTTIDPLVATLFACRSLSEGPAIVLVALKSDFLNLLDGPPLSNFSYECAVNIELPPDEFEKRCRHQVSVQDSLAILAELGYRLPSKLPDQGALTQALLQSPRMLMDDMTRFAERCQAL